ncbi:RIP metalloprotease RseP [Patescibacteria group bacterium]
MALTIVTFIIVLSILVFVHELGHFYTARKFGVKAEEFGFGFPPRVWGIYKDKEGNWRHVKGKKEVTDAPGTIYSINWLPIGGFVKIKGEDGEDRSDNDSFSNRKIWQRTIIILAGVTMNIVLAAVLISFGYMVGLPQSLDEGISSRAIVSERQIQVVEVLPNTPAEQAGMKLGDIVVAVNRNEFQSGEELQVFTEKNIGESLTYDIKRGGEEMVIQVTPEIIEDTNKGGVGIGISEVGIVRYPIYLAFWEGTKTTIFLTWFIMIAFYELIKGLILGQGMTIDLGGPVRIAQITGDAVRMGLAYLINFTALLSINLAIINAFPFPALDGGRLLFLIIEKIKGGPVKKEVEAIVHNIGFALLILLVIIVTFNDIARFWR